MGKGELQEGAQKVQNKYEECNVQHGDCCTVYMKAVKSVDPRSSHHEKKFFFPFLSFFVSI